MTRNLPLPQRLEQRLKALRDELETGQKMLADVEARRAELQQTILRISGAVQVLEELLAAEPSVANGVAPAEPTASTNALVEADA
jgi:prefoldin subunit 5